MQGELRKDVEISIEVTLFRKDSRSRHLRKHSRRSSGRHLREHSGMAVEKKDGLGYFVVVALVRHSCIQNYHVSSHRPNRLQDH